jgi:heme-degrading monooxygenase HmoA
MIQIVWQYEVKEEYRGKFELAYGPGGPWSNLFAKSPGFRGTVLLRDTKNPRRYLTVDSWDGEAQRDGLLAERNDEYSALDAKFREWADSEAQIGIYRLLAEASVRPVPGARRRAPGSGHKSSRAIR